MKLNNKGFAITGIIYSMLILFLTLVLLIIGNLASRKAVFDKQKEDLMESITSKMCTLAEDGDKDSSGDLSIGDMYVCNLGDGNRNFYVLEVGESTQLTPGTTGIAKKGEVTLILEENIDDESVTWCSNSICSFEELNKKIKQKTASWLNVEVSIPTAQQIATASNIGVLDSDNPESKLVVDWLNPSFFGSKGYWTQTKFYDGGPIWLISKDGKTSFGTIDMDYDIGIRPVITIQQTELN